MDEVEENHLIPGVVHHVRVSLTDALERGRQVIVGEDAAQTLTTRVSDLLTQDALSLTRVRGDAALGQDHQVAVNGCDDGEEPVVLLAKRHVVALVVSCFTCGLRCEVSDGGGSAALSDVEELVVSSCDDGARVLVEEQAASAHSLRIPRALVERLAREIARDHAGDARLFDANEVVVRHLVQEVGAVSCCGFALCLSALCCNALVVVGNCVVQHVVPHVKHVVPHVKHVGSSRCFLTRFARVVGVCLSALHCSIRWCVAQR